MSQVITYSRFWMRRDTAINWVIANPVLHAGELGIEQDPGASPGEARMKIGDGLTAWNDLDYFGEGGGGGPFQPLSGALTDLAALGGTYGVPITNGLGGYNAITIASGTFPAFRSGDLAPGAYSISSFAFDLLDDVDAAAMRATLGIVALTDGDKGDITVSGSGSTWSIDNGAVSLAKMADVASGSVFYRKTAGAGAPEVQTFATLKTDLGLTGTNSGDQTITLTGDVTGTGTGSFATTLATAQPAVHTWALAQTFTTAPIFTDASGSRAALGATTVGAAFFTLANPSAVTFPRIDAANTVTARSAANYRTDLGVGTGDAPTFAGVVVDAGSVRVNRSGDAASGQIFVDVDSGSVGQVVFRTGTSNRIVINKTATAESGSNVGSNLAVGFYEDDGTTVRTVATGNRASGVFDFAEAITFPTGKALALGDGGTGSELTDPGGDRIGFWDDSAGIFTWLALGSNVSIAGTTLNVTGSSVVSSGSANPGSPSTNDMFFRTDLGVLIYYDGTRWLTVAEYALAGIPIVVFPVTGSPTYVLTFPVPSDYGAFLTRWVCTTLQSSGNGTNFWTILLERETAANVGTTITSFTTAADTANNWTPHDQAINAALDASARALRMLATKTLTPGSLYTPSVIYYRKIIT